MRFFSLQAAGGGKPPHDATPKLGLADTRIVFCESFCRVKHLSLTGKLLYPIADRFVVQWPELTQGHRRAEYIGVLC